MKICPNNQMPKCSGTPSTLCATEPNLVWCHEPMLMMRMRTVLGSALFNPKAVAKLKL